MNRQTDRRTDTQTDRQTDRHTDWRTDRQTELISLGLPVGAIWIGPTAIKLGDMFGPNFPLKILNVGLNLFSTSFYLPPESARYHFCLSLCRMVKKNLNSSGEIEVGDKNNLETSLNRAKMWASNFSATIDYRFLLDIMSACHDLIFQRNSVIQSWIVTQKTYHLGKFRPNLPKFWPNNFFRKRAFPGLPQNWKMNSSQKSWKQWRFSRHFATRIGKKHMIFQPFQPFQPRLTDREADGADFIRTPSGCNFVATQNIRLLGLFGHLL